MNTISENKNIKLRQLGQTDIHISPIGLGCWQFSEGKGGAMTFTLCHAELSQIDDLSKQFM